MKGHEKVEKESSCGEAAGVPIGLSLQRDYTVKMRAVVSAQHRTTNLCRPFSEAGSLLGGVDGHESLVFNMIAVSAPPIPFKP